MRNSLIFSTVFILGLAVNFVPEVARAQNLEIYCIEVGKDYNPVFPYIKQGDSTLIISPTGKRMLIDGGAGGQNGSDSVIAFFNRVIPTGGLDYMVTTHYDEDHYGGLDNIANYNSKQYMPATIYDLGGESGSPSYDSTFSGKRTTPDVGDTINLGGGCTALCVSRGGYYYGGGYVNPGGEENARSIGLLIQCGGFDYLTLGDLTGTGPNVEGPLGAALRADGYNIDLLHASHHGSKNSTKNEFVADLLPEFAVISCGDNNGHGHPHQEAINHLNAKKNDGSPYSPAYPPVTTIYTLERGDSDAGTAPNVTIVGNGSSDPAQQGSFRITVSNNGYQYSFTNEGPNTNTVNDGPYDVDDAPPPPIDIGINEIAWMGTFFSSSDQWIELCNNTASPIVLNNWMLSGYSGFTTLTGTIGANSYFLLERTEETISDIPADLLLSWSFGYYGDRLQLWNNLSELVDEVDCSLGWFTGDYVDRKTMEKINPNVYGDHPFLWATWNGSTWNGLDGDGDPINGTAKSQNSTFYVPTPTPVPTPTSVPPGPGDVVINEIAWMGTSHDSYDEWIELYNTTLLPVDIVNWSIYGADTGATLNFSDADGSTTTIIPAHGYLIYANDNLVFNSGALVQIWDTVIGLNNSNPGQIILYSQMNGDYGGGSVIDVANQASGDWFAGDAGGRVTMERINPAGPGTDGANWGNFSGTVIAWDGGDNDVNGSPGAQNSIFSSSTPPPPPSATPTPPPGPTSTPAPSVTPTPPTPPPTATPTRTPEGYRTPTPTSSPPPTATPTSTPISTAPPWIHDYNGDGTSDIAIFRGTSGLWSVRGVTRVYFGSATDLPKPGDYDGDGTTDLGIFRGSSGLWAIRGVTRIYFGSLSDAAIPGDYDGDGCCDIGLFRESSGLWAIRNLTRAYFGTSGDIPVPGYYDGVAGKEIGLFRGTSGLWAIRNLTRVYFGSASDAVVPGDYSGDGIWECGIFRPSSGLWAIKELTRVYFGGLTDQTVPADYDGDSSDNIGIFRETSGLWGVRGITRAYYGASGDVPVTR